MISSTEEPFTSGTIYCWGANGYGQLGIGNFQEFPIPMMSGGALPITSKPGTIGSMPETIGLLGCPPFHEIKGHSHIRTSGDVRTDDVYGFFTAGAAKVTHTANHGHRT
jgi:hypothetical protein